MSDTQSRTRDASPGRGSLRAPRPPPPVTRVRLFGAVFACRCRTSQYVTERRTKNQLSQQGKVQPLAKLADEADVHMLTLLLRRYPGVVERVALSCTRDCGDVKAKLEAVCKAKRIDLSM